MMKVLNPWISCALAMFSIQGECEEFLMNCIFFRGEEGEETEEESRWGQF